MVAAAVATASTTQYNRNTLLNIRKLSTHHRPDLLSPDPLSQFPGFWSVQDGMLSDACCLPTYIATLKYVFQSVFKSKERATNYSRALCQISAVTGCSSGMQATWPVQRSLFQTRMISKSVTLLPNSQSYLAPLSSPLTTRPSSPTHCSRPVTVPPPTSTVTLRYSPSPLHSFATAAC